MRKALVVAVVAALLPLSGARALLPQNDAGYGADAPEAPDPAFRIEPGRAYDGVIEGLFLDEEDWYAFTAPARATVNAAVTGALGCLRLYDAAQTELASTCAIGVALQGHISAAVPATGTYYLAYSYLQPDSYRFSLGIDAPAPPTGSAALPGTEVEPLSSGGNIPRVRPGTPRDKHVVVAVVDTGINPYHEFFRAPSLTTHPSGWLPGFPRSAETTRLSLNAPDIATAKEADAETWDSLERTTLAAGEFEERLYTFPGTRVVAGISFGEYEDTTELPSAEPKRAVLDEYGHGTHSAGLAAGANLPEADGNVLIVAVEVGKGTFDEGILWAAQQPWIDAISVSLGTVANVGAPSGPNGTRTGIPWITRTAYASGKPVFIAAGNGVSSTGVAPDKCTTYTSAYVGPVWVTRIGAASPGGGNPTYWHCVPVEATARTNVASPRHDALTGGDNASGTSASTPNAAGHWAHLMLAGRRGGVKATRLKTLEYLLHAAAPPPTSAGAHDPSAYPASLADQGYGLIDARALDLARTSLLANSGPAARPETVEWFAQDRLIRIELWGAPPD